MAYGLLRPHTTIFLDAGTTVLQLARRLRVEPLPLTIFTNGLAVAQDLVNVEGLSVNLLGGQLRNENLSMVGPYAERLLGEFWFDQLYLGTSAVRGDAQMYTLNPAEASLNRAMIARTSQAVLLADASKFGSSAPYAVAPIAEIQTRHHRQRAGRGLEDPPGRTQDRHHVRSPREEFMKSTLKIAAKPLRP